VETARRRLEKKKDAFRQGYAVHEDVYGLRPCLVDVMEAKTFPPVLPGYDGHNLLIAAVVEYYHHGFSVDEILGLLSLKEGFDLKISEKMVKYVTSKYSPFRCSTIKRYGGCNHKDCFAVKMEAS